MRIYITILAIAGLVVAITGCGGGGGTSAVDTRMAAVETGSSYTYDVSVISGKGVPADGRMVVTISNTGAILSRRGQIQLSDGSHSFSSSIENYFTQDSSGSLLYAGEKDPADGRILLPSTRPISVRSPLRTGDTWSSSAALTGGAEKSWRSLVGVPETVSAAGRTFRAFPVTTTRENQSGSRTYTAWYSPECPAPVRAVGRSGSIEVTITLSDMGGGEAADQGGLDDPPAPPGSGDSGGGIDIDNPPPAPIEWEQQGQDVADVILEMMN